MKESKKIDMKIDDNVYPRNEKYKAYAKVNKKRCVKVYAVYKGDKFIDVGTVSEICKNQGWTRSQFMWLKSPTYQTRINKGKRLEIFELEEADNE